MSNAGVLVSSNLADKNLVNFSSQDLEKISQAGETILEKMDGLVIEETKSLAESGYLIALALAHKKPILYLLEKGKTVNKNLLHLKNDKSITKLLNLKNYTEKDLEQIILEFLGEVEKGEGKQLPNIKFTLRVTSRIERYLHWKTHNTKLSKADFLRELIKKLIDQDEDYKKFSNQRRED